jgi:phage shock protein PspC (stress-responsive transcriptional regulator)
MKKITRINLASLPYNIDIEANKVLEKYCLEIEKQLGADADAMKEIELRMTELLADRKVIGETVISMEDVESIKSQLGKPADFADESSSDVESSKYATTDSEVDKPVKRVMRDVNNRMLAGVCSGLAAYFKIDPVLVRVAAVVLLVASFGVMLPVYLLLWLIMPPAQTATHRLEMAGQPVTLEAIQKESAVPQSTTEPALLVFIRFFLAGVLLAGILGVLLLMARVVVNQDFIDSLACSPGSAGMSIGILVSGLLFVAMLGLLAYALIAKKFTKRMGVGLLAIIVAGLTSFGVATAGYYTNYGVELDWRVNKVKRDIDVSLLKDTTNLVVKSPNDSIMIEYATTSDAPNAYIFYDEKLSYDQSGVKLSQDGDSVILEVYKIPKDCNRGLCAPTVVYVNGPALASITSINAQFGYRVNRDQEVIDINMGENAHAVLSSGGAVIDQLNLKLNGSASVSAEGAVVKDVQANIIDAAQLSLGNVKNIDITTPEVCASNSSSPQVDYESAGEVKINGELTNGSVEKSCFAVYSRSR